MATELEAAKAREEANSLLAQDAARFEGQRNVLRDAAIRLLVAHKVSPVSHLHRAFDGLEMVVMGVAPDLYIRAESAKRAELAASESPGTAEGEEGT